MNVAKVALELVDYWFQGVAGSVSAQGDIFRPIDADNENAAACQVSAEVEEQGSGAQVRPLKVVDDEE